MKGTNGSDFGARGSRRYIIAAVEASLQRLKTDYIDLLQYHTPDPLTPIEETLAALDHLITEGKVRYIGHSNFAGWQIAQAEYVAESWERNGLFLPKTITISWIAERSWRFCLQHGRSTWEYSPISR